MRIAIIGGGIFGCHTAINLKKDGHEVTIFDKGDLLSKSTLNNQHRLHLGFHYPRSIESIEECKSNYDIFLKDYADCVEFGDNFYLIHKDSVIEPEMIISNLENMNLGFEYVDLKTLSDKLINIDDYKFAINTKEGFINLNKLRIKIIDNLSGINIIKQEVVNEDLDELSNDYDIIINLSYENPNLFYDFFNLKYEYCMIVNIKKNEIFSEPITIIDGPFISLYGACNDEMTLSSVKYTPFLVNDDYYELKDFVDNLTKKDLNITKDKIIEHCSDFLKFNESDIDVNKIYLSYKIKLNQDTNDKRPSLVKRIDNVISVLNGKISTVNSTYLKIRGLL